MSRTHGRCHACFLLALLALAPLSGGCLAVMVGGAAAAVGTVVYGQGELRVVKEWPLEDTYAAVGSAFQDLELRVQESSRDGLHGYIFALQHDDTKVKVNLTKQSRYFTEVKIRVGMFGDEMLSNQILHTIERAYDRSLHSAGS